MSTFALRPPGLPVRRLIARLHRLAHPSAGSTETRSSEAVERTAPAGPAERVGPREPVSARSAVGPGAADGRAGAVPPPAASRVAGSARTTGSRTTIPARAADVPSGAVPSSTIARGTKRQALVFGLLWFVLPLIVIFAVELIRRR